MRGQYVKLLDQDIDENGNDVRVPTFAVLDGEFTLEELKELIVQVESPSATQES